MFRFRQGLIVTAVIGSAVLAAGCQSTPGTDSRFTQSATVSPEPAQSAARLPDAPAAAAQTGISQSATGQVPLFASLNERVGKYPNDPTATELKAGPLADRLRTLLNQDQYKALLANFGVASPWMKEGDLLYAMGNRPHQGGSEAAAVVVDLSQNAVRTWLLTRGEQVDVQETGKTVSLPSDVRKFIFNTQQPAK